MNQPGAGNGGASCEPSPESDGSAWYIEVLGKTGWQPLRGLAGGIIYFSRYDDAVASAVKEWKRSDRPARPAEVAAELR